MSDNGRYDSALITYMYTNTGEIHQSAGAASGKKYDLLDFLGVAQRFKLDFLPVTWQSALDKVGEGGTAKIRQSMINPTTSFAFKLLKRPWCATEESQSLRALLAEISVLGHYSMRGNPHVANLEGICWDVGPDPQEMWPVLVFEKSRYGDLANFMTSSSGKALAFEDRVDLLFGVADAVRILHSAGVIHGDIKPENILIFRESNGPYVAKVIDFGYSTLFATDSDPIIVPYSPPWTAPEQHHRQILPAQARKMDAYSFGMLCLWLLFYNRLGQDCNFEKDITGSQISVLNHASALIRATAVSENQNMDDIQEIFRLTLAQDPIDRASSFDTFLQLLSSHEAFILPLPFDRMFIPDHEFQIALSSKQLIESHYGLRQYIARSLEARIDLCPLSRCHILNLAFCYELGFGIQRDSLKANMLLKENSIPSRDLEEVIEELRIDPQLSKLQNNIVGFRREIVKCEMSFEENKNPIQNLERVVELIKGNPELSRRREGRYRSLLTQGHFLIDFSHQYRREQRLREAETSYQREILTMGSTIGNEHLFVQELRRQLFTIMMSEERYEDAEALSVRMIQLDKGISDGGRYGGRFVPHLALTYLKMGRCEEAEVLQVQILETNKKALDPKHLYVLGSMSELGTTYFCQGRLEDAEKLHLQVLEVGKKVLGTEHEDVLYFSNNLGATYLSQGRLKEAEDLQVQVLGTSKRVTGLEDPLVLEYMNNLAWNYSLQLRWKEAEELQIQVLKTSREVLGMEHPKTLCYMTYLASILWNQDQWEEAEELQVQALRTSKRVLGKGHAGTLTCMVDLAAQYCWKGRWNEAEELQVELVEISKERGMEDKLILNYMTSLASNYAYQGRWDEAENLQAQVLETSKRVLGVDHPNTLIYMTFLAATYRSQQKPEEAAHLEA